jgi:hypothetical protein
MRNSLRQIAKFNDCVIKGKIDQLRDYYLKPFGLEVTADD